MLLQGGDGVVSRVVPVEQVRTVVDEVKVTIVQDAELPLLQLQFAAIVVDFRIAARAAAGAGKVEQLGLFVFFQELPEVKTAVEEFSGVAEDEAYAVGFLFVQNCSFGYGGGCG